MDLSQQEWGEKLNADDNAQILDVRTDEEVAEKQFPNAKQMDIHKPVLF